MNNKVIILTTSFFILVSFIFLATIERKQADINTKNIWMLYFENPESNSLDFTVENHTPNTNFHWQILADKTVVRQGDLNIKLGAKKTVPVLLADTDGKKITISVTGSENGNKEVYKIIAKN